MPEGLASIDDLKVVITASTEDFGKGLENAQQILAKFTGDAEGNLKTVDGMIAKLGTGIMNMRGALGAWAVAATTALDVLEKIAAKGDVAFKHLGASDEWDTLKQSVGEIIPALQGLISGQDSATRSASYLKRGAEEMALSLDTVDASAGAAARRGLKLFTEGVERATHEVRRLTSQETWSTHTADAEIDRVTRSIEALKARIDSITSSGQATPSFSQQVLGTWWVTRFLGLGEVASAEQMSADITRLEQELERLNELRIRAQWRNTETDTASAGLFASLEREIDGLRIRAAVLGMNAAEAAAYAAAEKIKQDAERQGLPLSEAVLEHMRERLALMAKFRNQIDAHAEAERRAKEAEREAERAARQAQAEAERNQKQGDQLVMGLEREIMTLNQKRAAIGGITAASVAQAAEERALQQAQQRGITLSDEQRQQLRAVTQTLGEQTIRIKELEDAMVMVRETGQAVTRGLEQAFRNWMNGQKVEVKEFVRQVLADLAMITLRRSVLDPLSSGITSGIGSLLGGALAEGGPAEKDVPYLIGERGPEIFVPSTSGHVVPNHAISKLSGDAGRTAPAPVNVQIAYSIDASGAYPESIADIKRSLAEVNAGLPARVVAVVHDARERGGL